MLATITLKNIPDELYDRLKEVANIHHRSINGEVIACLEQMLLPDRVSAKERITRRDSYVQALKLASSVRKTLQMQFIRDVHDYC